MKVFVSLLCFGAILVGSVHSAEGGEALPSSVHNASGLRCEFRVNPLGLDASRPRLSWVLESKDKGVLQTACYELCQLYERPPLQALCWGDWKAVRNGPSKPIEIYDLKTDAAESKNLAAERPELVAKAESLMKAARVDDPNWPLVDKKPAPAKVGVVKEEPLK